MKTSTLLLTPFILSAALLTSCKNPADETTDATVTDAQTELKGNGTRFTFLKSSTIGFTGSKVTGSHDGGFKEFSGHFMMSGDSDVPTAGEFTIQMASTWSDSEKLTGHLKNSDFFDVETFSTSTFKLTNASKTGENAYDISGNLTLHGVEKNITFPVTASRSGDNASFTAEFDINRKDFGIVYAGKTDDLIRDEVIIRLNFQAAAEMPKG
ncbi:MAG: YceI family protein [Akkermansiaceae bacterium]|jgi:polyisoprenoid-binding protein YceI